MRHDSLPVERRQRGESLIEVLVALAILLLVLVSILQLFSLSLLSFHATSAHRDMMRRAQEVVEIFRLVVSTNDTSNTSGILPLSARTMQLPRSSSDTGYSFWGPSNFDVVKEGSPYQITVNIADGGDWLITVFVEPKTATGGKEYLGPVSRKGVRYAARIPK